MLSIVVTNISLQYMLFLKFALADESVRIESFLLNAMNNSTEVMFPKPKGKVLYYGFHPLLFSIPAYIDVSVIVLYSTQLIKHLTAQDIMAVTWTARLQAAILSLNQQVQLYTS